MTKLIRYVWTAVLLLVLFCLGVLVADKQVLKNDVIRLHVVANSDSEEDQRIKLAVRDAVLMYIRSDIQKMEDSKEARNYLYNQIKNVEQVANDTLQAHGAQSLARVSLCSEEYGQREYDTFSLPSGVYESLRIEIGSAEGKNWWCVVFPSLCLPSTTTGFKDVAVSSGLDQGLVNTLSGDKGYEIRFFFLDCLGKLENFFNFE